MALNGGGRMFADTGIYTQGPYERPQSTTLNVLNNNPAGGT